MIPSLDVVDPPQEEHKYAPCPYCNGTGRKVDLSGARLRAAFGGGAPAALGRELNALIRAGFRTPEQVDALTDEQLLEIRTLGTKGVQKIRATLRGTGPR